MFKIMNDLENIKVSVVMGVYGYKNYIEGSIESILNQTFRDIELIIIDDGCDYDLFNIVQRFKDKRILYVKNNENIGLTRSLIKGINFSKGKYIARQDAGNISKESRIERQYNFLESNKAYYLIGTSVTLIDEKDETVCKIIADSNVDSIKKNILKFNCINHSTIMFRNKGVVNYRAKFKYSQDYDLYLNLLSKNILFGNISDILLEERILPDSITYKKRDKQNHYKNVAREFYFERLNTGKDSYNRLKETDTVLKPGCVNLTESDDLFFNRQKAYYLFYSGRLKKVRKLSGEFLNKRFDWKMFYYFIFSYFPIVVRWTARAKEIKFL